MEDLSEGDYERKKKIAARLFEVGGIKFGNFTLTSGKTSPYYVDLRIVPSHPKLFDEVCEVFADLVGEIRGDYKLAGVPTSGLPFATLVSQKLSLPLLYVRKGERSHGRKKGIEGEFEKDEIVLIDDVSTTGGSLENAAETVKAEGGVVNHAVVFLDREEGAEQNLKNVGIDLRACFTISELVECLRENAILDEEKYSLIMENLEENR